jgi:hypothetical protein
VSGLSGLQVKVYDEDGDEVQVVGDNVYEDWVEEIPGQLRISFYVYRPVAEKPAHRAVSRYTMYPYEEAPRYYYGSVKRSCACGDDECPQLPPRKFGE